MEKLLRIEIHDADGSDTYRALMVYWTGDKWYPQDFATIGEAARRMHADNRRTPIYNLTGKRHTVNKRNLISNADMESGSMG